MTRSSKTTGGRAATNKTAQVIALLSRKTGANLDELIEVTGWLPHTMRAALTGLRKKGHVISREKVESVTRYSIEPEPAQ